MRQVGACKVWHGNHSVADIVSFRNKPVVEFKLRLCPFMIMCGMEYCGYAKLFPTTVDYLSCSKVGTEAFEMVEFDE